MVSKAMSPKAASRPVKVTEPVVHQWGYQGVRSEIAPTLQPKPQNWPFAALGIPGAAAALAGFEMVAGHSEALPATVAAGLAGAAGVTALGLRKKERSAIADRATEDVAVHVSTYLTRKCLKVLKWEGGWIGYPARIRIRYAQGAADNPSLKNTLAELLEGRVGLPYRLISENPRNRSLVYEVTEHAQAEESDVEPGELEQRIDKIVNKLFTPRSGGENPTYELEWEQETLHKIVVRHDISDLVENTAIQTLKTRKFSNTVPGRWKASWDTVKDTVTFTRRPELPTFVPHPPIEPFTGDPRSKEAYESPIRFGRDETGEDMAWRPWLDPMMLITGRTGRGKTVVAHSVLTELAARGWLIDVSDAKLIEFLGYASWPNVRCVAAVMEEQVRLVHAALDLMKERYAKIVSGEASEDDFQPYVLFLDEYALFREDLADWYMEIKRKGDPTKVPTTQKVNAVLRAGRTARVHLVILTQRPDAEILGSGEPRANLSCRVSLGPLDRDGAIMMWGTPNIGMSIDPTVRGRGTTRNAAGEPVEFQAYWTPDPRKARTPEDLAIIEGLRPAREIHQKMAIILPKESEYDEKSEEVLLPSYGEYAAARMVPADQVQRQTAADWTREKEDTDIESETSAQTPTPLRPPRQERSVLQLSRGEEEKVLDNVTYLHSSQPEPEEEEAHQFTDAHYGPEAQAAIEDIEPGSMILLDESAGTWAVVTEEGMPDDTDDEAWALLCITEDGEESAFIAGLGEIVTYRPAS